MKTVPPGSAQMQTGAVNGEELKMKDKPVWLVLDGDATVEADDDGMGAWIKAGDEFGDTVVRVEATIDLGEGEQKIAADIVLSTQDLRASNLGIRAERAVDDQEKIDAAKGSGKK